MAEPIGIWLGVTTLVGQRNHVLDGVDMLHDKGQFWGLSGPLKSIGSTAVIYAAKGILQSSITARYAMRSFVKII